MDSTHKDYLIPYEEAVKRHGPGFTATLWNSREFQRIRFEVITGLVSMDGAVVLDAGCGTGDLAHYLLERGVAFKRYIGIDAMSAMIESAQDRMLPRCEFKVADVVSDQVVMQESSPDIICMSGTLNTMKEATARKLVNAAFDASSQAVVFNFLSDRVDAPRRDKDLGPSRRFNTIGWLDWALTLTPRVKFRHDYLDGHDATIMLGHGENPKRQDGETSESL